MTLTDWISAVSTLVTSVVAVAALWFAGGQLREASAARSQSKMLDLEKSQPYVVLTMEESVGPEFIDIVIRNYGQTIARDVRVEISPMPQRSAGASSSDDRTVLLPEMIPALAPGQEWRTFWDSGRFRRGAEMADRHDGIVTYLGVNDKPLSNKAVLDWGIYKHRQWMVQRGLHDAAQALRDIRDNQKKWTEFPSGLAVVNRDGDVADEAKAEQRRQFFAAQSDDDAAEGNS